MARPVNFSVLLLLPPTMDVSAEKDVLPKKEVNFYETEDEFHFAYEDGTRFQPFGTTCYAWVNQTEAVQEQTLDTLKILLFNKIRMCIFPKILYLQHY